VLALSSFNSVYAVINPTAATVSLRMTCTENGAALNNCFTTPQSLTTWMAGTRRPNAANPLRVEVGAGKITGNGGKGVQLAVQCDPANGYTGYTSFIGAGPAQSIIYAPNGIIAPVTITSCTEMNFSELGFVGAGGYGGTIVWSGGGNSSWNHVAINTTGYAWREECEPGAIRGNHYWTASRLTAIVAVTAQLETYWSSCDESWFFGSEITASSPTNAQINSGNGVILGAWGAAVFANGNGIVHVYGSVIRALIDTPTSGFPAVSTSDNAEVHIHGTGIDLISTTGQNMIAIQAGAGSIVHANETAYNFVTTGTKTRILNQGGHVHAPYFWQNHPEAPVILSDNGADMSVVTANTSDGQPHMVIYSSACASHWYDTVDRVCRQ